MNRSTLDVLFTASLVGLTVLSCLVAGGCEGAKTIGAPPPPEEQLVFTVQPANAIAGGPIGSAVVVTIEDSRGSRDTAATNVVTLAIGTNPGGGTLTGTESRAAVRGLAVFADLHIDKAGKGYTLTATATGVSGATSAPFDITPAAARLAFTVQPGNAIAGASLTPAIQVTAEDASGNTVTAFAGSVTVALGANPGGGTLAGVTTVTAVSGVATFSGLSILKAGSGYTLTAATGTVPGATSTAFAIAPAAPAALVFAAQPSVARAGVAISPAVAVAIADAFGNTVPSAAGAVTVAIGTNPGGGSLSGTTTVNAVNGVASFGSLSIQKAGSGYTLTASSGSLPVATSSMFAIVSAAAASLSFLVPPGNSFLAQPIFPAVQVAIQDAFGNTVTTATSAVTLALAANPGGATLSGSLTVPAVGGVATFTTLSLDQLGSGYTLAATCGTLTGATSPPFAVGPLQVIAFVAEDQSGNHKGIATMRTDGSNVVPLTSQGEAPAWSPDRTKIAFVRDSGVFVMNADGTGAVNILPAAAGTTLPTWLAWKPDGTRLAFAGAYNYASGLFLMGPDGSNVVRIAAGYMGHPSWSPDGSRLVMECQLGLCTVNADGSGLAVLAKTGLQPAWKPDGTKILFADASGLEVVNPDGSGVASLLSYPGAVLPAWSADGQRIAFVVLGVCIPSSSGCFTTTADQIVIVNADGSGTRQVINPAATEPAWRP